MLTVALFELDLVTRRLVFPQAGLLEGFVETNRLYEHEPLLKRFLEEREFPEDRETVLETLKIRNYTVQNGRMRCEFRLLVPETGEYQWANIDIMLSHDKKHAIGTVENIHKQKERELELQFHAEHDTLTGLMNRNAFRLAAQAQMRGPAADGGGP